MAKLKKGSKKVKRTKKFVEPQWDPWYCKMLDAVGEYLDSLSERENQEIDQRDITIIKALIEFYGFEPDELKDVLDDVNTRTDQLERMEKREDH
jgi:hypothetical protein